MPFASHLNLFPSSNAYESNQISDAELAQTLALWTNVDFSYDDGGVGLDSGRKLFEDDQPSVQQGSRGAEPEETAPFDLVGYNDPLPQQQPQQIVHSEHDPLDPFGFITSLTTSSPITSGTDLFPHPLPSNFPSFDAALPLSYNNSSPSNLTSSSSTSVPTPSSSYQPPPAKKRSTTKTASASVVAPTPAPEENLSVEDDKRRRNTAASARFRQKKKEREQALEKNSKELQSRCALLEREVESLRQENNWLKGLVVGGSSSSSGSTLPEPPVTSVGAPTGIDVGPGQKRKREEEFAGLLQSLS